MRWLIRGVLVFLLLMPADPYWYWAAWYYGLWLLPFYCWRYGLGLRLKPL
jgi:hypothetical protein